MEIDPNTEQRLVERARAADVSVNDYLIFTLGIDMPFYGDVPETWRIEHEERRATRRLVTRKSEDHQTNTIL